jgi:hypothetical protein
MKLLFITEIAPYPPFGGEKIRTMGLLNLFEYLALNTFAIIGKTETETWKNNFKKITFQNFFFNRAEKSRWGEAFAIFKKDKKLTEVIMQVTNEFNPDVVYIDYYFYGQYIEMFKKMNIPVLFGTHNAQAGLILQRPSLTLRNNISNRIEYVIYRFHEIKYLRKADALIAVSEQDLSYYKRFIRTSELHLIPNFVNENDYIPYHVKNSEKENYIIMTGNFYAYQNAAGLQWFLEKVWDKKLSDITKLKLAGTFSKEILKKLNIYKNYKNIEALGVVENIKPIIAKAKASIVPLLHGSGTRLKCIEAMALKTQIISTSKGAEGINHNGSIIIADEANNFRNCLLNVLKSKSDYTNEAYKVFMANYSIAPNAQIFNNIITQLKKKQC